MGLLKINIVEILDYSVVFICSIPSFLVSIHTIQPDFIAPPNSPSLFQIFSFSLLFPSPRNPSSPPIKNLLLNLTIKIYEKEVTPLFVLHQNPPHQLPHLRPLSLQQPPFSTPPLSSLQLNLHPPSPLLSPLPPNSNKKVGNPIKLKKRDRRQPHRNNC